VSAQDDAEVIRRGYEAFGKGDMDTIGELFADDIRWTIPGRSHLAGVYKGKAEVFEFFGKLAESSAGSFSLEVDDIIAGDHHVVALTRESASRDGKSFSITGCHVWTVKDGKSASFVGMNDDPYAEDEFWG
jgi:ketosteroid isomerase-like protein